MEEENSVTLSCELSKPGVAAEWRKGEELLKTNFKYQMRNRNSLLEMTIKNTQLEDGGLYSCICGDAKTTANITVTGKTRLEMRACLDCLKEFNRILKGLINRQTFLAPAVRFFNTAIPLTFKLGLKNQEAPEGGNVILRCELSRAGVPVQWWKGEDQLYHAGRYQMTLKGKTAEMHIKNTQPEDVGEYSCVFGGQKTTAEVNVRGIGPAPVVGY